MQEGIHQHNHRKTTDRIESTVLKIQKLIQCFFFDEHDCQRTHEERTNAEADHDDKKIVSDRESSNYTVKTKRRIKNFKIDKHSGTRFLHILHALL